MDINRTNMQALFTSYNKAFSDAFRRSTRNEYKQFCTVIEGTTSEVKLPFLEQLHGMREWIDKRLIQNVASAKLSIVPRHFEQTVAVDVTDIEDDQYGIYTPLIAEMAVSASNMPNDCIVELLQGAENATWMDGAAFFGTTREYGEKGGVISNYATAALTYDSFNTAYDTMTAYRGHGGDLLDVKPSLLVHGSALRIAVADLIHSDIRATAVGDNAAVTLPNPNFEKVATLQISGITDSSWFLLDATRPVKPVFMYMRKEASNLVRMDKEDSPSVFYDRQAIYGVDGRCEAAFALPHLVYYSKVS